MSMHAVEITPGRAPSRVLHDPLRGTEYRMVRRLGAGATSEVYEAVGPRGARCAVKVLRAVYVDDPKAVFRLHLEARALSSLDHPSLSRVLDVGATAAWRPFFAMPLLDGETARDRLGRRGPIAPAIACAIMAEALGGLDAAHRGGVVHRDVKPAHLFLPSVKLGAPRRRCVVLDFGVAKILGASSSRTTASRILGTPRYLAPEQILCGHIDARTDVYAAGLTLFELIAGQSPFDAEDPIEIMRAHLEAEPRDLREHAAVSAELAHAVSRAIAKAPSRRWPSARAFAAVVERAAAREVAR